MIPLQERERNRLEKLSFEKKNSTNPDAKSRREKREQRNGLSNLNGTVVLVVGEAERTESTVHTIQAVHIAFALV